MEDQASHIKLYVVVVIGRVQADAICSHACNIVHLFPIKILLPGLQKKIMQMKYIQTTTKMFHLWLNTVSIPINSCSVTKLKSRMLSLS